MTHTISRTRELHMLAEQVSRSIEVNDGRSTAVIFDNGKFRTLAQGTHYYTSSLKRADCLVGVYRSGIDYRDLLDDMSIFFLAAIFPTPS